YTLVNPAGTAVDATTYTDETVNPETTYFYYVAGVNAVGTGASSDTISVTTENNDPVITAGTNIYVKAGATANFDFTVADNAGETVTVEIKNKPSFISLQNTGGTGYRIVATPSVDHIGW